MVPWSAYQLDENGQVTEQDKIEPFFDVDEDALFERPAIIGGTGYFPSFSGTVQEIDLSGGYGQPGREMEPSERGRQEAELAPRRRLAGGDGQHRTALRDDARKRRGRNP